MEVQYGFIVQDDARGEGGRRYQIRRNLQFEYGRHAEKQEKTREQKNVHGVLGDGFIVGGGGYYVGAVQMQQLHYTLT